MLVFCANHNPLTPDPYCDSFAALPIFSVFSYKIQPDHTKKINIIVTCLKSVISWN